MRFGLAFSATDETLDPAAAGCAAEAAAFEAIFPVEHTHIAVDHTPHAAGIESPRWTPGRRRVRRQRTEGPVRVMPTATAPPKSEAVERFRRDGVDRAPDHPVRVPRRGRGRHPSRERAHP